MIEPEIAFYDIHENMDLAEDFIKYLVRYALENCNRDLQFLNKMIDKDIINRLEGVCKTAFARITYTEAVDILLESGKILNSRYRGAWICKASTKDTLWKNIFNVPSL